MGDLEQEPEKESTDWQKLGESCFGQEGEREKGNEGEKEKLREPTNKNPQMQEERVVRVLTQFGET